MRIIHNVGQAVQEGPTYATVVHRTAVAYQTITEHQEQTLQLAAEAEDVEVSLGCLESVTTLYLEADQDVEVKLAGAENPALALAAGFALALVVSEPITSILLSNPGLVAATVKIVLGA